MSDVLLSPTANSTGSKKRVHSASQVLQKRAVTEGGDEAHGGLLVGDENERARLITELSRLIREPSMPEDTRTAGLTLIGWLARRMPGEQAHALGVTEARESERRIRAARPTKAR
jgi:hypothetical protein